MSAVINRPGPRHQHLPLVLAGTAASGPRGANPSMAWATARVTNFGVGQRRRPAQPSPVHETVVDLDVERGEKSVQICRHKQIVNTLHPSSVTTQTYALLV